MSDEEAHSPDGTSSFDNSFAKSTSRKQSVDFVKRSTDNSQIEQNFKTSNLAKERATAQKQMLQECSFEPSIKGLPKSYGPNKTAGTLVYNRLTKWEKNREVDMKQKKVLRAHEEVKNCTFKPQINKHPKQATSEKHATTRLYEESAMIAANKVRLAEQLRAKDIEKQIEECTFKPRLSTRRTAWAKVEPKYNQPPDTFRTNLVDIEKENEYSYTPQVNEVGPDMISASLYLQESVTDRLTKKAMSSPVQKAKPTKERTIIDMATFLSGPMENEAALKSSSRDNVEHPYTISTNYFGGDTQCEQGETEEKNHPPALSATERERRKDNFQAFLTRQHAAQEKKKIQVQELEKSLFPKTKFEVNKESKKIISQSQKGEFMERLQHDVELRKDRMKEPTIESQECTFKPSLHKSQHVNTTVTSVKITAPEEESAVEVNKVLNPAQTRKKVSTYSVKQKQKQKQKPPPPLPSAPHPFKPELSTSSFHNIKKQDKRASTNPDVYRQQHEQMLERRKQQQEKHLVEEAEREMEGCTFTPQIIECPKFVSNIARSISVVKSVKMSSAAPATEGWK